jgi:hypothetical protein
MRIAIMLSLNWLLLASSSSGSQTAAPAELVYVCRYPDGIAQQGETICLAAQRQLARCEKVLNNASWRLLGIECDLPPPMDDRAPPRTP